MRSVSSRAVGRVVSGASLVALCAGFVTPATAQAPASPVEETPAEATQAAVEPENVAETAITDDEGGLGVITVTARKVAENLQDVPVAVTAFTGSDLANQNIQRVQDIGNFTPGMAIRPGSSTGTSVTIAIRGQVQTDILATLDPSAGTYVDGVYWSRAYGLNGSFLDVQSVQVLKGPQGTLFGRNTTGGALLINSNDPELGEFSGRSSFTYGRFDEREVVGIINVPIGEKVALRVAATGFERDGYTRNFSPNGYGTVVTNRTLLGYGPGVTSTTPTVRIPGSPNRRLDDRFRRNARAKLLFQPVDNLSLLFSAEYFKTDEHPSLISQTAFPAVTNPDRRFTFPDVGSSASTFVGACTTSPATCSPPTATSTATGMNVLLGEAAFLDANERLSTNNEASYNYAKTQTYNFIGTLDTDFGAIKLVAGYRKVKAYSAIDLEGSSFPIHITEGKQELDQLSGELQFTGKAFNDAVDFAGGMFAFHEDGFDQSLSVTIPTLNAVTSHFYGLIDNDSMGVYTQATWHLNDQLAVTGGVRYSVDDKGLESRNNNYFRRAMTGVPAGTTVCSIAGGTFLSLTQEIVGPSQCAAQRRDSFSGWSYTAGLDYKPTEDILLYVKTAKGFRSGGQNLRAPSAATFLPFDPEVAYAYEIGFKGEFLDRRLRVNLAAYQTDVNDIQRTTLISTGGGGTATILGNAGKARIRGGEAEVTALLFEGFRLTATGALVRPKYIRFSGVDPLTGDVFDRSTERFSSVAKKQFSLAADYDTALTEDLRIRLHADYSWRDKIPTDPYNYPILSGGGANPVNPLVLAATTAPSLGLLGARATLEYGDNYELSVFGRNLTNERDIVAALAVLPLGYANSTRQEPTTYGVTATVKF